MPRLKFALLLPCVSVIVTSGLWLLARAQYSQHLRASSPPDGTWVVRWSDYTPFSLVIAGILNIPVATFAAPLYHLMQSPAKAELTVLLLGVAVLWGYIGRTMDKRNDAPMTKRMLRGVVGSLGVLFGLLVLVVSVPMFHVGVLYKAAALVWSFFICRHFLRFFRSSSVASHEQVL